MRCLKVVCGFFAIWLSINVANCQFTCNVVRTIAAGGTLTLSNPNAGNNRYASGSSCLYQVTAPVDFAITATCTLNIDQTANCASQRFLFSRDGQRNLAGAEFQCGAGTIVRTTVSNLLFFAYTSVNDGRAGSFSCTMRTINIGPTTTNCDCGWTFNNKIVGGSNAPINHFTSNVGLTNAATGAIFCHGAIISHRFILSVAHCFVAAPTNVAGNIRVLVGDHDTRVTTETPFSDSYTINLITRHALYNPNNPANLNDIALLRTVNNIRFSRAVGPVCLPYRFRANNALMDNRPVSVVGWGSTSFGGPVSSILQLISLSTTTNSVCALRLPNINNDKICTFTAGRDTCQYDSGANLYHFANGRYFTVGLTSYGVGCATSNPSVSTRVTSFITWIEQRSGVRFCNR